MCGVGGFKVIGCMLKMIRFACAALSLVSESLKFQNGPFKMDAF